MKIQKIKRDEKRKLQAERRISVISDDSTISSNIYSTQQSIELGEMSVDMQQPSERFVKNERPKTLKKFVKVENKRKRFTKAKSIDIKDLSLLGGFHNLNEITDKFADKLKRNDQEADEEERKYDLAHRNSTANVGFFF